MSCEASGGNVINSDRMWHYPEGIQNYAPIWSRHGIRILSGPSPLWLDARGKRLPVPLFPGFDSLGALEHITRDGHDHSWFLLNERIIGREFALSGSEQNPDLTERSIRLVLGRIGKGAPEPVRRFMERGDDFVIRKTLPELVAGMNQLGGNLIDAAELEREIVARDREIDNKFGKDAQVMAIRAARNYLGDKLIRVAKPHRILDPAAGPLIAVQALGPHAQDARRIADRSVVARAAGRRRAAARRLCGRRGRGLRRRRRAWLSRARRHVPRRLHLLRPHCGARGRRRQSR